MKHLRIQRSLLSLTLGASTAAGALSASGCASLFARGDTVVGSSKGSNAAPQEVPGDGEYVLHNAFGDLTPLHTVRLRRGDLLGFRRDRSGEVVALAGDHEWILSEGSYVWNRR